MGQRDIENTYQKQMNNVTSPKNSKLWFNIDNTSGNNTPCHSRKVMLSPISTPTQKNHKNPFTNTTLR